MTKHITLLLMGVVFALPATAADLGAQVFEKHCAVCHQADAQGAAGLAPPLKGPHWAKLVDTRTYVPGVLLAGMNGTISLEGGNFTGVMPPQNSLSDDDIAAVSNYLYTSVNAQTNWKPLTAADVASLRQALPSVASLRALRKQGIGK